MKTFKAAAPYWAAGVGSELIFLSVFWLYRTPWEPVLYAAGLSTLLWGVVLSVQAVRERRASRERRLVAKNLRFALDGLPEPRTREGAELTELLLSLRDELNGTVAEAEREQAVALSYYSLWVHQIKTPIAVMRLRLGQADSEEHRALSTELFRVERYANMALSFARLNAPTLDMVIRRVPLDDVIRAAARTYAVFFVRKGLAFRFEGTQETALTDEKWLGFILEQLLSNAVKYTQRGSVTVRVENGVLSVADTGCGIAPEDLPRVCERGYTGLNGRTTARSTGLGLWLCRTAADRLGHRLYLESTLGEGTVAYLDLRSREIAAE
ncbi:MAG: sensor histidine kinase [Clostridia bacterium]|nr:sensor histidine kinase [Clostridia bacterium]